MDKLTFEEYCDQPAFAGGPPFPYTYTMTGNIELLKGAKGITRLEYFTAMAMAAFIQNPTHVKTETGEVSVPVFAIDYAEATLGRLYRLLLLE